MHFHPIVSIRSAWRFLVRALMFASIGPSPVNPDGTVGTIPQMLPRALMPEEKGAETFIRLLSAVDHLERGILFSVFSRDSYLARLQAAQPNERLEALEYYHCTLADYHHWCRQYGNAASPVAVH